MEGKRLFSPSEDQGQTLPNFDVGELLASFFLPPSGRGIHGQCPTAGIGFFLSSSGEKSADLFSFTGRDGRGRRALFVFLSFFGQLMNLDTCLETVFFFPMKG